jgi:hypothetical protein
MRWKQYTITAILITLGGLSWYVMRPDAPSLGTQKAVTPELSTAPESPASPAPTAPATPSEAAATAANLPLPSTIPAWELKIDEALRSQADHAAIARILLQQVLTMPPEGQHSAAQHIANLMSDSDYLEVLPYVQNLKIAQGFQEVIVAESLNRPKEVKLPVLLAAARTPLHPMKETALSVLSVLLDQNHGTDFALWEAAVQNALKQP